MSSSSDVFPERSSGEVFMESRIASVKACSPGPPRSTTRPCTRSANRSPTSEYRAGNHRFAELKPHVEDLVRRQTRLLNGYLAEAEKVVRSDEGIDDETGLKLLRVSRGGPKMPRFMKLRKEQGVQEIVRRIESNYMRDKAMWEADEDLYYVIEEKQNSVV